MPFPLHEWFDTTRPISREDRLTAEAQMALYAFKEGRETTKRDFAELRQAVKEHNKAFDHKT